MNNIDRNGNVLVSIETAKLLKLCGFNLCVYNFYNSNGLLCEAGGSAYDWNSETGEYQDTSAPSQSLAQKWLREVKKISVEVKTRRWVNRYHDGKYTVSYTHELWPIDTSYIVPNDKNKFIRYTIDFACNIEFQTYEEALEAGIKECLTKLYDGEI